MEIHPELEAPAGGTPLHITRRQDGAAHTLCQGRRRHPRSAS